MLEHGLGKAVDKEGHCFSYQGRVAIEIKPTETFFVRVS